MFLLCPNAFRKRLRYDWFCLVCGGLQRLWALVGCGVMAMKGPATSLLFVEAALFGVCAPHVQITALPAVVCLENLAWGRTHCRMRRKAMLKHQCSVGHEAHFIQRLVLHGRVRLGVLKALAHGPAGQPTNDPNGPAGNVGGGCLPGTRECHTCATLRASLL